MAEAIATLGLAANIIQFIDYGARFMNTVWKIYSHSNADRGGNEQLNWVAEIISGSAKIREMAGGLVCQPHDRVSVSLMEEKGQAQWDPEGKLHVLAEDCLDLAQEVGAAAAKIKWPRNMSKRAAVMAALRVIWHEKEVKCIQERFRKAKDDLALGLLVSLRAFAMDSIEQQEAILAELQKLNGHKTRPTVRQPHPASNGGIAEPVVDFLTCDLRDDLTEQLKFRERLMSDIIKATYTASEKREERDKEVLAASPPSCPNIDETRRRNMENSIISRLCYHGMEDREDNISEAHKNTFQWIFSDRGDGHSRTGTGDNFKDWLESDDKKLFWITGKPGSGKSTLMKYICCPLAGERMELGDDMDAPVARCHKYLRKWAGDSKLITASFYFWNSGIPTQMWVKGFFMTLLHQIFKQHPALIPLAAPRQWESMCLFGIAKEWTDTELLSMLNNCASYVAQTGAKLCLFIDGLDEFAGDKMDFIRLAHHLLESPQVKFCVSSRPWVEFEDGFKHAPSLLLQDLTRGDMSLFVQSRFQQDHAFSELADKEPVYTAKLTESIVEKSSGVFLWVNIVVESLLVGIRHGDRISDLQKCLEELPPELEKLYEKILMTLDPFYLQHAAQLYKLVEKSPSPPSLLLLSFADEETLNSALGPGSYGLSFKDLEYRTDTMRRRLSSRFKGLLEVTSGGWSNGIDGNTSSAQLFTQAVRYLHRTVKDYFESPALQKRLSVVVKGSFDPHLLLCAANIAELKVIIGNEALWNDHPDFLLDNTILGDNAFLNTRPSWGLVDRYVNRFIGGKTTFEMSTFWGRVDRCLYHAALTGPESKSEMVALLDELDNVGKTLAKTLAAHPTSYWASTVLLFSMHRHLLEAGHWVTVHPFFTTESFGGTFLSLVVHRGVVAYVEKRANPGCLVEKVSVSQCFSYDSGGTGSSSRSSSSSSGRQSSFWDRIGGPFNDTRTGPKYCVQTEIWPLLLDALYIDVSTGFKTLDDADMVHCLLAKKQADPNKTPRVVSMVEYPSLKSTGELVVKRGRMRGGHRRGSMDRSSSRNRRRVTGWLRTLGFVDNKRFWTGREFLEPLDSIVQAMVLHGAVVNEETLDLASDLYGVEFRYVDKAMLLKAIQGYM